MSGRIAAESASAGSDIPPHRVDRVYETNPPPARERRIMEMLAPFRRANFPLAPPVRDFDRTVRESLALVNVTRAMPHSFSLQACKDAYASMPYSVREEAKAGVRKGLERATVMPLARLLERAAGWKPDLAVLSASVGRNQLFETMVENLDDATGGFLPAALAEGLPQTIAYAVVALASARAAHYDMAEGFLRLYRAGNVPVGVLTDNTFLVLVR